MARRGGKRRLDPTGAALVAGLALAALAGCSTCPSGCGPYISSPTGSALTPAVTGFNVRYNPLFEDFDEVKAVIAAQCGPNVSTARIVDRPVGGTVLHPAELTIVCGDPPPRAPRYRGEVVDPGELIQLR